jgi:hypothetical protein
LPAGIDKDCGILNLSGFPAETRTEYLRKSSLEYYRRRIRVFVTIDLCHKQRILKFKEINKIVRNAFLKYGHSILKYNSFKSLISWFLTVSEIHWFNVTSYSDETKTTDGRDKKYF